MSTSSSHHPSHMSYSNDTGNAASNQQPHPPPPPQPVQPSSVPQLFSVDAEGNGAGRIISESGDIYEGSFHNWLRHGWGIQHWSTGAIYRGTWEDDKQKYGVFQDAEGKKWKGDFSGVDGEVVRIGGEGSDGAENGEDDGGEDGEIQEQLHEEESKEAPQATSTANSFHPHHTVTHFPPSAFVASPYDQQYQYQYQYQHSPAEEQFMRTQPMNMQTLAAMTMTNPFTATLPLPIPMHQQLPAPISHSARGSPSSHHSHPLPPHSSRTSRSAHGGRPSSTTTTTTTHHNISPRRPTHHRRPTETPSSRAAREEYESLEEQLIQHEYKKSIFHLSARFGSEHLPHQATFGLVSDSPGPAAYSPLHTQTKPSGLQISMSAKLPYQVSGTSGQKVRWYQGGGLGTKEPGPWSCNVTGDNITKPGIPKISLSHPPLLPKYVTESVLWHDDRQYPGPGAYEASLTSKGKTNDIGKSSGPTADMGGFSIKSHYIPLYNGRGGAGSTTHTGGSSHSTSTVDSGKYNPSIEYSARYEQTPKWTMRGRRNNEEERVRLWKTRQHPGPCAYTPEFKQIHSDPIAKTTGFGMSRSCARPHLTESLKAIPYTGSERMMRLQYGLQSPGPAAYDTSKENKKYNGSTLLQKTIPSIGFGPHIVQPSSRKLAQHFIETGHPFVKRWKEKQAQARELQKKKIKGEDVGEEEEKEEAEAAEATS